MDIYDSFDQDSKIEAGRFLVGELRRVKQSSEGVGGTWDKEGGIERDYRGT